MAEVTPTVERLVTITEAAAAKVRELLEQEGNAEYALRLQVVGGGCSGFQYRLAFDDQVAEDDELIDEDGFKVVVDPLSARYLEGASIDYVETEMAAGFKIENPNVKSTCGCGSSHAF
jgi:iron-sulfur cluster insertion protein